MIPVVTCFVAEEKQERGNCFVKHSNAILVEFKKNKQTGQLMRQKSRMSWVTGEKKNFMEQPSNQYHDFIFFFPSLVI